MRQPVLELIEKELNSARDKFIYWPTDPVHAAAIVAEEAGELVRAALRYTYEDLSRDEVEREACQTAAMAIRFLDNLYEMKRLKSPCVQDQR